MSKAMRFFGIATMIIAGLGAYAVGDYFLLPAETLYKEPSFNFVLALAVGFPGMALGLLLCGAAQILDSVTYASKVSYQVAATQQYNAQAQSYAAQQQYYAAQPQQPYYPTPDTGGYTGEEQGQ